MKEYAEQYRIDAQIKAIHINLGFKTSDAVWKIVRDLAEKLGVELHVVRAKDYLDIEAAARRLAGRYAQSAAPRSATSSTKCRGARRH